MFIHVSDDETTTFLTFKVILETEFYMVSGSASEMFVNTFS